MKKKKMTPKREAVTFFNSYQGKSKTARMLIWDMISALRFDDSHDTFESMKFNTSGRLRYLLLGSEFQKTTGYFTREQPLTDKEIDETATWLNHVASSHFRNHFIRALTAARDLKLLPEDLLLLLVKIG